MADSKGRVQIENRTRSRIFLPAVEVDGKKHKITLGSTDDEGREGCEQPEQTIAAEIWGKLAEVKAIGGMIQDGTIRVRGVQ